jgi:hypothetical protein
MWLPIPNFNDYYCSEEGQIKNKLGKILPGTIYKSGYRYVSLYDKNYRVNRIVASTFLPQPTSDINSLHCDHLDRNRLNNKAENLQWKTCKENQSNRNNKSLERNCMVTNKLKEKFICLDKNSYRLKIKSLGELSWHKTLEEAIKRRDFLL